MLVRDVAVTVDPPAVTLRQGETQTFAAIVTGTVDTAVIWSADGGTIAPDGTWTAPAAPGSYTISATSAADPAKAALATATVPVATGLAYVDPPPTGWRLVRNAALSDPQRLVLDLHGPVGEAGRGVDLTLAVDPGEAGWTEAIAGDPALVRNVAFQLGTPPQLLAAHADGGTLRAGVFQKGTSFPATPYGGPLVSVALSLAPGAPLASGTPLALSVAKAAALPPAGGLQPILVQVGTLVAE